MSVRITHCVCHEVSFAELKAHADACGIRDLDKLKQDRPFGRSCGSCLPYVQKMPEDGTVVFNEILPAEPPDNSVSG